MDENPKDKRWIVYGQIRRLTFNLFGDITVVDLAIYILCLSNLSHQQCCGWTEADLLLLYICENKTII